MNVSSCPDILYLQYMLILIDKNNFSRHVWYTIQIALHWNMPLGMIIYGIKIKHFGPSATLTDVVKKYGGHSRCLPGILYN